MSDTVTTSIRLPVKLRRELEQKARSSKRGMNWIVKEALESYLHPPEETELRSAAQRQSLVASAETPCDAAWAEQGGDGFDGSRS